MSNSKKIRFFLQSPWKIVLMKWRLVAIAQLSLILKKRDNGDHFFIEMIWWSPLFRFHLRDCATCQKTEFFSFSVLHGLCHKKVNSPFNLISFLVDVQAFSVRLCYASPLSILSGKITCILVEFPCISSWLKAIFPSPLLYLKIYISLFWHNCYINLFKRKELYDIDFYRY